MFSFRKYIYLFLVIAQVCWAGDNISIRILPNLKLQSILLTSDVGNYNVVANTKSVFKLTGTSALRISVNNDSVELKDDDGTIIGEYTSITIEGESINNSLKLKTIVPDRKPRTYDDNLIITVEAGYLKLINRLEVDKYIAGVVQAESGTKAHIEFYKVQSILARTFALAHLQKHIIEGYSLCDQVHCQAYIGKSKVSEIQKAVFETKGKVVIDQSLTLITAAFHSNSGGQTANSEDVWGTKTTYLRSIVDTFSTQMPNAKWERRMPTEDWLGYLKLKYNFPIYDAEAKQQVLAFNQYNRKVYLEANNIKIPLKNVRTDLQLKSTFFNITTSNDTVIFKGRGYGHGLGMCQEGAMLMAKKGYNHVDIINFYYKNIQIIDLHLLHFFRDE